MHVTLTPGRYRFVCSCDRGHLYEEFEIKRTVPNYVPYIVNNMKENTLNLILIKKWFDMTLSGAKKEDYREITPYWLNRLTNMKQLAPSIAWEICAFLKSGFDGSGIPDKNEIEETGVKFIEFDKTKIVNGYGSHRPTFTVKNEGVSVGVGKQEWGAPNYPVFIIKHSN